jgi:hypothetical protein
MDPSKAHDVGGPNFICFNLSAETHILTNSRCFMSCPSNTLSAPL